jgi:hypothetical protein
MDDLAMDAEIGQDPFEKTRVLLERVARHDGSRRLFGLGQEAERRHRIEVKLCATDHGRFCGPCRWLLDADRGLGLYWFGLVRSL